MSASGADEPVVDDADHDVVADETAGIHHLLGHQTELGALTHGGAQHVTGGDVRNDEVPGQSHALRALAGTLSPEDDEAGAGDHRRDLLEESLVVAQRELAVDLAHQFERHADGDQHAGAGEPERVDRRR